MKINFFNHIAKNIATIMNGGKETTETPPKQLQFSEIEKAIMSIFVSLIQLDKNFSAELQKNILQFLQTNFGENILREKQLEKIFKQDAMPYLRIACNHAKSSLSHHSIDLIVQQLFFLANESYFISTKKIHHIHRIAQYLGISKTQLHTLEANAFAALAIDKEFIFDTDAPFETNNKKYKKLILKFHPDRAAQDDKIAHEKFIVLQQSFAAFKRKYYPEL